MDLRLTSGALATLHDEAARAAPRECCGLLLGRAGRIDQVQPAANLAADPARHFEIDPAVLIVAHRAARDDGPEVLGYYHSHPQGLAAPSPTDQAQASGDGRVWAIIAGDTVGCWRDAVGGFEALPYAVDDG